MKTALWRVQGQVTLIRIPWPFSWYKHLRSKDIPEIDWNWKELKPHFE